MEEEVKKSRGRKPKTQTDETKVLVEDDNTQSEIEKLTKEKEEMAKMFAQMKEQMEQMKAQMVQPQIVVQNQQNSDLTRTIKVTSLLPNLYVLPIDGKENTYVFREFGQSMLIPFTDMQKIISKYLKQFENGYAILSCQKDYDDLQIGYVYDNVLSKEQFEQVVKLEDENSIDIILGMESDMQEKIINMIARDIINGVNYDYNKIQILKQNGLDIDEVVDMIRIDKELSE